MIDLLWHLFLFPALLCYYLAVGTTICLALFAIGHFLLEVSGWVGKRIYRQRMRRVIARQVLGHIERAPVEEAFQWPDRQVVDKAEFEAHRRAA